MLLVLKILDNILSISYFDLTLKNTYSIEVLPMMVKPPMASGLKEIDGN